MRLPCGWHFQEQGKQLENTCLKHIVMEFNKMEALLEKYFEGETSIAEENVLKNYFSSSDVAPHLEQYRPLFGYFAVAKEQKLTKGVSLVSKKRKVSWLSIAASIAVLIGVG